jgi:hypothetical protein
LSDFLFYLRDGSPGGVKIPYKHPFICWQIVLDFINFKFMGEKIKVTLEVEAGKHYTIKPLGEKLAEKTEPIRDADNSVTATVSGSGSSVDADVDVDF